MSDSFCFFRNSDCVNLKLSFTIMNTEYSLVFLQKTKLYCFKVQ